MKIYNLYQGGYQSNCYYVTDDDEKNAIVIDPSVSPRGVLSSTETKLCAVLLTHPHYDHLLALEEWRAFAPAMISYADADGLIDSYYNVSYLFGNEKRYTPADRLLREGDAIAFGNESLTVLMTPGHTQGSCCFYTDGILFSGDTIFEGGGIGRSDFHTGSYSALESSLQRVLSLDPDTKVYPGHGMETTIGFERSFHTNLI